MSLPKPNSEHTCRQTTRWWDRDSALAVPFVCVLLSFCWLFTAGVKAQEESKDPQLTVDSIQLEGNYTVFRADVLDRLGVEPGDVLSADAIRTRVERVNAWGGFGEVNAELAAGDDQTVVLNLNLQERVNVERLRFVGNENISGRRLRAVVELEPGATVTPDRARSAERAIADAYKRMERPLAAVTATARFTDDSPRPVLRFGIVEGPKAFVRKIEVHGNTVFSDGRVRGAMKTQKRSWLSFIWPGKFDERQFRNDIQRVQERYYNAGYLDASAAGYWTYSADFKGVIPHVVVFEGTRYRIRDISFSGNRIFTSAELRRAVPLEEGSVFRPRVLEKSKAIIRDMYGRQGHMDVGRRGSNALQERLVFNPEETEGQLDVVISVDEGNPVHIRRVRVEGLTRTDELVVLRNLTFKPGDRADTEEFETSERVLEDTGYFDRTVRDPVDIRLEEPPDEAPEEEALPGETLPSERALRDAVVEVKEGKTGSLMFGAGVSSESGLLGQFQVTERNFDITNWPTSWRDFWEGNALRGGGQRLELQLSLGTESSSFLLSFSDPSVNNSEWSFSSRIFRHTQAWEEFDLTKTGFSLGTGRRFGRLTRHDFDVGYEFIDMSDVDDDTPPEILKDDDSFHKPYISGSVRRDTRDSTVEPTEGYITQLEGELAFVDIETVKLVADAARYWPVWEREDGERHVLRVSGRAGVIDSWTGDRVPVFERFYAGGRSSLRGFARWGVSPVEPIKEEQVGGESILLSSVEYSLPAITRDLRLAAFMDAGYVKEDAEDLFTGWDEVRLSTGVGFRWTIPALGGLPLTVDLAVPLVQEDEDTTRNVHFSLGASHSF